MHCFLAQDWITIRGPNTSPPTFIIQSEACWLDLSGYQNVVAWLDVREWSGATSISVLFQTAPLKDESMFVTMGTVGVTTNTLTVTPLLKDATTYPLTRWVRWRAVSNGATGVWDLTFRLWIAASGGAGTKTRQRIPRIQVPDALPIRDTDAALIARYARSPTSSDRRMKGGGGCGCQ